MRLTGICLKEVMEEYLKLNVTGYCVLESHILEEYLEKFRDEVLIAFENEPVPLDIDYYYFKVLDYDEDKLIVSTTIEFSKKTFLGKANEELFDIFLEKITPYLMKNEKADFNEIFKIIEDAVRDWLIIAIEKKKWEGDLEEIKIEVTTDPVGLISFIHSLIST